jgi:hypothetical protein
MSSNKVNVRLSNDAWTRYSAEAQARRVALATFIRQRLEDQDRVVAELSVRAAAANSAAQRSEPCEAPRKSAPAEPAASSWAPGTLVEVLLLLRVLAGPQKTAMVQKEVERRGLASWK